MGIYSQIKSQVSTREVAEYYGIKVNRIYNVFCDYLHLLNHWAEEYAPRSPTEDFHPLFVEAMHKRDYVEYLLDLLLYGSREDKAFVVIEKRKEVDDLERRIRDFKSGDGERAPGGDSGLTAGHEYGRCEKFDMLKTERLILRHWKESDAIDLYEFAKDPDIGPIAGWPPHQSIGESLDVIRNVLNGKEAYALCLRTDDRVIGAIELKLNGHTDLTERDDECELGYWLGKPFWGKGIMPEAAGEMLRHAFEDLGMQKVWCGYYDGNVKSKRVQEKCGFRYLWTTEGVDVPLMHEKRTGHVNCMTKKEWIWDRIHRVDGDKKQYLTLLLLADEQEDMIDRYLERGTMFVLEDYGIPRGECVATDEGNGVVEIKNLAVAPEFQGKGYGRALIEYVTDYYREEFTVLQVGTGDSPITVPFYERCGFRKHHVLKNFFMENYDHPIFEGGKQLIDMVVLRQKL